MSQEYRETMGGNLASWCDSDQLYDILFEEGSDCTFLVEADGRVIEASDRSLRFAGVKRDQIIMQPFWETPWFEGMDTVAAQVEEDIQRGLEGESVESVYRIQGTDEVVIVDASIRPIPTGDGTVDQLLITCTETTELRQRLSELEAQNESLEEFVRVVAHDVRSVLGVATGNLQLASEKTDVEELDAVENALERVEELVDGLSEIAREGALIGERSEHKLAIVANEAWNYVESPEASLQIDSSRQLRADGTRLVEVFENLYRNAIEHAGPDVTVRVGTTEAGFYVEDDGPGLQTADQDPFEFGVSTATDGMGLGLALVETIVEAHGWSIRATDGRDGGARFEIRTPEAALAESPSGE